MVGSLQEGQREAVNAVVDRLVEGGVPRGGVEREVNVGGVRPRRREGKAGFGGNDVCRRTKVSHVGSMQEGDRPVDLNR